MPSSRATRASRRAAGATAESSQNEGSVEKRDTEAVKKLRSRSSDAAEPAPAPAASAANKKKKNTRAGGGSSSSSSLKSPSTSKTRRTNKNDDNNKKVDSNTTDQLGSPSVSTGLDRPSSAAMKTPPSLAMTAIDDGDDDDDDEIDIDQAIDYVHLFDRKRQIEERVKVIELPGAPTGNKRGKKSRKSGGGGGGSRTSKGSSLSSATAAEATIEIPYTPKTDTHWDFVMKEMMWLGADFAAERKRQIALGRKCSLSLRQWHKNKESRRLRELAQAESKRRKLAAKLGRECKKQFWSKLERVISYKQKLQSDEERKKAMNKQLVVLVKQTEKYTESLSRHVMVNGDDEDEDDDDDDDDTSAMDVDTDGSESGSHSDSFASRGRSKKKHRRRKTQMTIEEALAAGTSRKTKSRIVDYSRMKLEATDFYGESTASDASGSDGSFSLADDENESDDGETLRAAIQEEMLERRQSDPSLPRQQGNATFLADPEELRQLHEEQTMDIEQVLQRLQQQDDANEGGEDKKETRDIAADEKRVHFAEPEPNNEDNEGPSPAERRSRRRRHLMEPPAPNVQAQSPHVDPGADADDDGDASDVEDYMDLVAPIREDDNAGLDGDGEEEYEVPEVEPDDERTMEQEESLPRDMTYKEEIDLLEEEADMSIEELRRKYSAIDAETAASEEQSNSDNQDDDMEIDDTKNGEGEEEFVADETEVDDETTMAQEESMPRDISYKEEIDLLEAEANMSVEDLRKKYGVQDSDEGSSGGEGKENFDERSEDDSMNGDGEDEFVANEQEVDDETTMAVEEALPREMSYQEEIKLLEDEANLSVEELRQKYAAMEESSPEGLREGQSGSSDDDDDDQANFDNDESDVEGADDEFEPASLNEVDDETTIEAEEKMAREMTYEEEICMLEKENDMSVDDLKAMYSGLFEQNDAETSNVDSSSVDEDNVIDSEPINAEPKRKYEDISSDKEEEDVESDTKRLKEIHLESDDGAEALNALEASAERARQTLATRPFLLANWVKLRKYQQTGLNWLVSMQSRRLNGILADEMGLGKTLQTISLLAYLAAYKGIWGPHLVIVPTSVILNWETELKRFCPGLKVLTYYGSAKRRKELRQGWTQSNWYNVVITSYQLAVQDAFAFRRKKWYYLILDEAQNIKNFQSQRWQTLISFNTQRRLLLTGTPLQNSLMELWSLLHFLMPYIFQSRKEFSYWFSNPMNNIIEGNVEGNDNVIQRLHGIIRPFILRRLKKDVETQMPGKFEHIVKCQLSRRQMTLYEEFLSRSSTRNALKKGGNFLGMMNVLMQLRKVCNHPDLFEPRSVVTPLVIPGISLTVPRCTTLTEAEYGWGGPDRLSINLVQPLWCGTCGLPSIGAALRHDPIEARGLCRLVAKFEPNPCLLDSESSDDDSDETPSELQSLLKEIQDNREREVSSRIDFHDTLNRRRCTNSAFPYSSRLLNHLEIEVNPFDRKDAAELRRRQIIETPLQLLELRRSQMARASEADSIIEKFVFCVPPAGTRPPILDNGIPRAQESGLSKDMEAILMEPLEESLKPFRKAHARLSSFFPDKKLVQYDAGKLQTLAKLLRNLKQGGHRVLIFTQMSKMLDILEAFLNINGHTYLRLDGATGVDRRQRYMDRFNNDEKIFCFILSTRSGGMGINLTGADTVIFYDSDWNPAMDAQAQDRAHRIGQTRDVHIYRLITEHSIEENILSKAKQKKNLDILVMDQGKFDASSNSRSINESSESDSQRQDVYSKKGLQSILGISKDDDTGEQQVEHNGTEDVPEDINEQDMEKVMTTLEDEDDVQALRGAQKEAAEELKEFDESAAVELPGDDDDKLKDTDETTSVQNTGRKTIKTTNGKGAENEAGQKSDDEAADMEKDFAAWNTSVGVDINAIETSLSPLEKYGLRFKEDVDPFYSIFALNEERRKLEAMEESEDIDVEELERQKEIEESKAIEAGDLLATGIQPEDLVRQRNLYRREKARLVSEKKRRKLTGENWSQQVDGLTKKLFWYNQDTGEAQWEKPKVIMDLEADDFAVKEGWGMLPVKPLLVVMSYLSPFPDRQTCALACHRWKSVARDIRFVRHVYPVEMGALTRDPTRMEENHFSTISAAIAAAQPGDSIELGDGHYWVNEPGMIIDKPLRIVGDEDNPTNVVIEMAGSVKWTGNGGWIEGITFRRPKLAGGQVPFQPMLSVMGNGKVDIVHSIIDNDGSVGPVVQISGPAGKKKGTWEGVVIRNGGSAGIDMDGGTSLDLTRCRVRGNGDGIKAANKCEIKLVKCKIERNKGFAIRFPSPCKGEFVKCTFEHNRKGVFGKVPNCGITSSGNTAIIKKIPERGTPGFKFYKRKNDGSIEEVVIPRTKKTAAPPSVPSASIPAPMKITSTNENREAGE